MDPYLKEALDMRDELVAHRRYLHAHAELGFELPQAVAYVCEKLREYGDDPLCLGGGVYGWHDPHVQIDEDALPYGAAVLSSCAAKWLATHKK